MSDETTAPPTRVSGLSVNLAQDAAYRFTVRFDKDFAPILVDEPPPLGKDAGPNAARLLAAAIGNCLAASLVFCLGKRGHTLALGLGATVDMDIVRTAERRLRIGHVQVTLKVPPEVPADALDACRGTFEDFCTVTASIRRGIDVSVVIESA